MREVLFVGFVGVFAFGADDDANGHGYEAQEGKQRADDYAACAEDVRVECLGGAAAAQHQQEAEDYGRAGASHDYEIDAFQWLVCAVLFFQLRIRLAGWRLYGLGGFWRLGAG